MAGKSLSGILIGLSSLFLLSSVVGIGAAWYYNEPLTREWTARLNEAESTLTQIQGDIQSARAEVERALRIIDSTEQALATLTQQTTDAKTMLEDVDSTLNDNLIPGLKTTRDNISQVRGTLEDLRGTLEQINTLPFVNLNIPGDELLVQMLTGMDSLDSNVANLQDLAGRASTFLGDTSYLLGGDFTETKGHLQELLIVLGDYDMQITGWRAQVADLTASLPGWIDRVSVGLTVFLLWFGLSQFGLLLHGLSFWRGGNPLEVLRQLKR